MVLPVSCHSVLCAGARGQGKPFTFPRLLLMYQTMCWPGTGAWGLLACSSCDL
jgi:hypothetical protein